MSLDPQKQTPVRYCRHGVPLGLSCVPCSTDLRWDSQLFRRYEEDELATGRSRRGVVELRYPFAWDRCPSCGGGRRAEAGHTCALCFGHGSIKDLVRELAGHRCLRCRHPFRVGASGQFEVLGSAVGTPRAVVELWAEEADAAAVERETRQKGVHWSPCDEQCRHEGPTRWRARGGVDDTLSGWQHGVQLRPDEEREVEAAWRILTVHHATEEKRDCRWWNLLSLCQRCHLQIQGKVQMDRVWPWEHSDWFKPYVAGFYALRYEGRDVTRAEAEARMDELLAYERAGA